MKMLIGGQKVDSRDKKNIDVINPATGVFLDTIPMATKEDINEAVIRSKNGQKEWSFIPLLEREKIISRFLELFEDHKEALMPLAARESGKHVGVAIFEVKQIPTLFRGYFESAKRLDGRLLVPGTELGHDGKTAQDMIMVVHEPLGTVAAIIPFNAPLLLFAYKVAPALAAGNAVIVKPPTDNPLAVIRMSELMLEAGVPGDALQVVSGSGSKVGKWILENPGVDGVSMTGSTNVGLEIAMTMAKRLAPCSLELGGNDPFIVFDDTDLEYAAKQACGARTANAGQVCIAPKRFIIQNSIKGKFTKRLIELLQDVEMGFDDNIEEIMRHHLDKVDCISAKEKMGCLINEKAAIEVEAYIKHTIEQGASLLYGGHRNGAFFEPTVLGSVTKDMDIAKDMEVFAPVFPIIGFDTVDEAIAIANGSSYGLSGCVMTKDWKKGMYVANRVESGNVIVNGSSMYRNQMQPFGGYKMSGVGREGFITIEEMTQIKNIVLKGFYE